MIERRCDLCGRTYNAARVTSKFCGGTCRNRAARVRHEGGRQATPPTEGATVSHLPLPSPPPEIGAWGDEATEDHDDDAQADVIHVPGTPVARATWKELHAAGALDTPAAQAALVLAARVDANERETGSALASVVRQLTLSLGEAKAAGSQHNEPEDPITRLRRQAGMDEDPLARRQRERNDRRTGL